MTSRRLGAAVLLACALVGCGPAAAGSDAGAADGSTPTVQDGRVAVLARRCDQCHQSPDPALGILSGQTTPVPGTTRSYGSNLTPDPDTGMDGWDAGTIAAAVLAGIDDHGRALCPSMPREASLGMSQTEALSIAAYLQSLTPVWQSVPQSMCALAASPDDGGR